MGPRIDSRIKTPYFGTPLLSTESEDRTAEHNSSTEFCYESQMLCTLGFSKTCEMSRCLGVPETHNTECLAGVVTRSSWFYAKIMASFTTMVHVCRFYALEYKFATNCIFYTLRSAHACWSFLLRLMPLFCLYQKRVLDFGLKFPTLSTRAKSRDHEIVRAQRKVSKGRPKTSPKSGIVVTDPQVQCEVIYVTGPQSNAIKMNFYSCGSSRMIKLNKSMIVVSVQNSGMVWSAMFALGLPPRDGLWK